MNDRLPTLVTYRSAVELRDAGIRYAYLKACMHAGLMIGMINVCVVVYLTWSEHPASSVLLLPLLIVGVLSIAIAGVCGKAAEFPHAPRLTLEELDTMRNDMGLSPEIFRQTHDSVLQGSFAEHKAIEQTDAVLARVQQLVGKESGSIR